MSENNDTDNGTVDSFDDNEAWFLLICVLMFVISFVNLFLGNIFPFAVAVSLLAISLLPSNAWKLLVWFTNFFSKGFLKKVDEPMREFFSKHLKKLLLLLVATFSFSLFFSLSLLGYQIVGDKVMPFDSESSWISKTFDDGKIIYFKYPFVSVADVRSKSMIKYKNVSYGYDFADYSFDVAVYFSVNDNKKDVLYWADKKDEYKEVIDHAFFTSVLGGYICNSEIDPSKNGFEEAILKELSRSGMPGVFEVKISNFVER